MSTTCDIDDLNSVVEAAGHDFATLLRELAMEHGRIKLENAKLSAKINQGIVKQRKKTRFSKELVQSLTRSLGGPTEAGSDNGTSEGRSLQDEEHQNPEQTTSPSSQASLAHSSTGTMNTLYYTELHFLWRQSSQQLEGLQRSVTRSLSFKPDHTVARGGDSLREEGCMQRFIVGPNSLKRMFWDLLSIIILTFDIVMVPMIAFDIPETEALNMASLSCGVFWTLDMFGSFMTGFHIEGAIEMRPKRVFKNYLQGWFPFDLLVVLVDWILFSLTSDLVEVAGLFRASKVLRLGRVLRALRLLRLVRVMKMPTLLDDVADNISTDGVLIFFRVVRSLISIGVASHFLACGWYAVGRASNPSWISELDEEGRDLAFRYASALHWSLTQFIPAGVEIYPRGFPERLYAICVLFLALVVFSSFVSSITNAMNHLHQMNEASSRQRSNLRRYIHENKLSLELGNRIIAYARHLHVRSSVRVHENEIDVFKVLPEPLRLQLHWEVYVPILSVHPLMYHFSEMFEPFVLELCENSLKEKSLMTSQELFSQDEEAKSMYFCLSGSLEYCKGDTDIRLATVHEKEWCSEIALWLVWVHEGQLTALTNSEFIALEGSDFRKNASRSADSFIVSRIYALSFQQRVGALSDDLPVDIFYAHSSVLEMAQKAFEAAGLQDVKEEKPSWMTTLIRTFTRSSQIDLQSEDAQMDRVDNNFN